MQAMTCALKVYINFCNVHVRECVQYPHMFVHVHVHIGDCTGRVAKKGEVRVVGVTHG